MTTPTGFARIAPLSNSIAVRISFAVAVAAVTAIFQAPITKACAFDATVARTVLFLISVIAFWMFRKPLYIEMTGLAKSAKPRRNA